MKSRWLVVALLSGTTLYGLQATTPQAALEELATTTKPEVIARHLPEAVQKSIEVLPRLEKQQVMDQLVAMKDSKLNDCTVRPAHDADGWEIVDENGNARGKVRLDNAFISGLDALLPLHIEAGGNTHTFIVTMHLEGDEWRIDDFGPWEKSDLGLDKLVHQPTEMEKNEAAAKATMQRIVQAAYGYSRWLPQDGFPSSLKELTEPLPIGERKWRLLDESFAEEPLIKDGYQFRYLHTSGDEVDFGSFEITAVPVEFGKSGSKSFYTNGAGLHSTTQNRPATVEDPAEE